MSNENLLASVDEEITQNSRLIDIVNYTIDHNWRTGKILLARALNNKGSNISDDGHATIQELRDAINNIKTGSGNAQPNQVLEGATFTNNTGEEQTGTIPSKDTETIIPNTTDQTINSGQYLSGDQIIKGDINLNSNNIKAGSSIFGVDGTFT